MKKYLPQEIEPKWLQKWDEEKLYRFNLVKGKDIFYTLVELPYPSGDLHIGHWFTFATPDVLSRYKRMKGLNVFFPHGYDAFGLPAENAAMKRHIHPQDWTMSNIESMTKQFKTMGTMIDWSSLTITCLPEYYRWNQWIFIKLFEQGLAYRGTTLSNWCETDQTVLANENVENGKCWRCGNPVVQKEVAQWFLKITAYADKLVWPEKPTVDWPESVRVGQNNWIGRSEGKLIKFSILNFKFSNNFDSFVEVYTTRPETIDGATFLVLAPEHPLVEQLTTADMYEEVQDYKAVVASESEMERKENKKKTGVFTGSYMINPVTKKQMPVWISDYVLIGYGTGAIMAVPAEDERDREFAEKFKLPIEPTSCDAKPEGETKVHYHIHDWSISRQRYWGTPVPIIYCRHCAKSRESIDSSLKTKDIQLTTVIDDVEYVMHPVPLDQLPVELPYDVDFTPHGKPPLASNEKWLHVKCPKCGGDAQRDAETLDTFFDSSWYYYRYVDPHYTEGPFDPQKVKELLPVDIYFGGAEHTLGHTLYARFFTKFFHDQNMVDVDEFAKKRVQHGIVLGPDGNKMSKSKGNVINPDDVVKEYGADSVRLYLNFMMPYEATSPWSTEAIEGMYRFVNRVWHLADKVDKNVSLSRDDEVMLNKTIKKVGELVEQIRNNTAIAAIMEWLNYLSKREKITEREYKTLLLLLAPFTPFVTEELWRTVLGEKESIHLQQWPTYHEKMLIADEIKIPIQVNGKVRGTVVAPADKTDEASVVAEALKDEKVKKYVENKEYSVVYVQNRILNIIVQQ